MATPVKFWFDATCPFAWATSRWIKEVEKVRDITVEFEPMSLSVLNEGRDLDPEYMEMMKAAWGPARVFAKVKAEQPDKVDELYTSMGTLIHVKSEGSHADVIAKTDEIIAQALEEVGLPAEFAEVAHSDDYDDKLREYHHNGISSVGDEVGTPVLKLGDTAFFGPVITRVPKGEEAGELFDASVRLAQFPYFFELKRSRTEMPQVKED